MTSLESTLLGRFDSCPELMATRPLMEEVRELGDKEDPPIDILLYLARHDLGNLLVQMSAPNIYITNRITSVFNPEPILLPVYARLAQAADPLRLRGRVYSYEKFQEEIQKIIEVLVQKWNHPLQDRLQQPIPWLDGEVTVDTFPKLVEGYNNMRLYMETGDSKYLGAMEKIKLPLEEVLRIMGTTPHSIELDNAPGHMIDMIDWLFIYNVAKNTRSINTAGNPCHLTVDDQSMTFQHFSTTKPHIPDPLPYHLPIIGLTSEKKISGGLLLMNRFGTDGGREIGVDITQVEATHPLYSLTWRSNRIAFRQ